MENLNSVKENFEENLKMIDQIINIGDDVGNLVVSLLEGLEKKYENMPAFLEYKNKLNTTIETIRNIKEHKSLKKKYEIIHNQALVLIVENFESFLNSLVKNIIDKYPSIITWPESKKKLPVDVTLLRYSAPTVGELVLTSLKGEVNFQDLKSTLRFFEEYLSINIELEDSGKDLMILGEALRNIIVHNNSKVDHGFLNQVRDTTYKTKYKDKEEIKLEKEEYENFKRVFLDFAKVIISELSKKI